MEGQRLDLPRLGGRYDQALQEALAYLFSHFEPSGIIVSGSIVRGNPDAESDLDILVIHAAPFRQRVQRRFQGVPAELFVNSPDTVRASFASERERGHPYTAHMLATGHLALDTDGTTAALIAEAKAMLDAGPQVDEERLTLLRYYAATWLEDALDVAGADPDLAALFLHNAVEEALHYRFWTEGRWQPRHKELLSALAELDTGLTMLARRFYRAGETGQRIDLAFEIARRSLGETGFFEWESERDPAGGRP